MGSCCVQEGKGACPLIIVRWALRNIREVQTMDFWESVQHRNGECRARGERASCACLCHLPFSFSFPPWLCLYFLATLNNVKKKTWVKFWMMLQWEFLLGVHLQVPCESEAWREEEGRSLYGVRATKSDLKGHNVLFIEEDKRLKSIN